MGLEVYRSLDDAIKGCFNEDAKITRDPRIMHGGISSTAVLELTCGRVFVKFNSPENSAFFDAEEEGIAAIESTNTVKTPKLYCKGYDSATSSSFIMMELIERGRENSDTWTVFGREFADMHLADTSSFVPAGTYGFIHDNFIGATKQINTPNDSWIEFFRQCRLEPQLEMACHSLSSSEIRTAQKLLDRLDELLEEPEHPSLLHGDMWGGNHLVGSNGKAVLIDPAAYVGHAEADIAMTHMFSPMPYGFYRGYHEIIPESAGYRDRQDLYNLYHYLNHFNLFGGGYLMSAMRIIRHYA
ncbi:MAG: fructosamine kinase family protein [Lachnospiraceae bacterium]|nr:fructosamine kinase family protein [Lachnospiraceae bacterium]